MSPVRRGLCPACFGMKAVAGSGAETWSLRVDPPTVRVSPGRIDMGDVTGEPLSCVPLSEPRSSTVIVPGGSCRSFAWRRDRLWSVRSSSAQSSDLPIMVSPRGRPMVAPGSAPEIMRRLACRTV